MLSSHRTAAARPHTAIGGWPAFTYRISRSSADISAATIVTNRSGLKGASPIDTRRTTALGSNPSTCDAWNELFTIPVSIAADTPWPDTSAISKAVRPPVALA